MQLGMSLVGMQLLVTESLEIGMFSTAMASTQPLCSLAQPSTRLVEHLWQIVSVQRNSMSHQASDSIEHLAKVMERLRRPRPLRPVEKLRVFADSPPAMELEPMSVAVPLRAHVVAMKLELPSVCLASVVSQSD